MGLIRPHSRWERFSIARVSRQRECAVDDAVARSVVASCSREATYVRRPNITGEFGYNRADGDEYRYAIGAFSTRNLGQGYTGNLNVSGFAWTFSASDSSEAYGNSSTVQPPALRVLPLIKT